MQKGAWRIQWWGGVGWGEEAGTWQGLIKGKQAHSHLPPQPHILPTAQSFQV